MMSAEPDTSQAPWTVVRLLGWTADHFGRLGIEEARLCAEILLAHAMGCERIHLYTRFDEVPGEAVLSAYRELVRRAARHAPIAYLVGYKEFFSLRFEVTPDVLIPRPETETLVEQAVARCEAMDGAARTVLDVGTGSGCVIVTLLKRVPHAVGVATDVSAAALEVAKRNAVRHGVAGRVRFVAADRFDLPADAVSGGGFDLIVSNPPYVSEADMATLSPNVREHEPRVALTPGGDGLDFYRAMAADGPDWLVAGGSVLVEIGAGQGARVVEVMTAGGRLVHVGTHRGPNDPHDRVMHFGKV